MRSVGDMILRTFIVFAGLSCAILAAGLFLSYGFSQQLMLSGEEKDVLLPVALPTGALFFAFVVGMASYIPAIVAITIAELMRWRGMVINLCIGALVAIVAAYNSLDAEIYSGGVNSPTPQGSTSSLIIVLAAGFIGGFIYWLIAGRGAGKWMDDRRERIVAKKHSPSQKQNDDGNEE